MLLRIVPCRSIVGKLTTDNCSCMYAMSNRNSNVALAIAFLRYVGSTVNLKVVWKRPQKFVI